MRTYLPDGGMPSLCLWVFAGSVAVGKHYMTGHSTRGGYIRTLKASETILKALHINTYCNIIYNIDFIQTELKKYKSHIYKCEKVGRRHSNNKR